MSRLNHNTKMNLSILFLIIINHSYENGSKAKLEYRKSILYTPENGQSQK